MPNRFAWRSLIALSMCATLSATGLTQGRRNAPVTLPDGPGKEIVQNVCGQCHGLGMVTNDGYSREEWPRIFGTMVDLPKQQADLVADYLATHFPEKPKPQAVLIAGPRGHELARGELVGTYARKS